MSESNQVSAVIINVLDDANGTSEEFQCDREKLVSEMEYFKAFLSSAGPSRRVRISVHCDLEIFRWLFNYMNQKPRNPIFETQSIVSILLSSEFLTMKELSKLCAQFMVNNIADMVKLPIDFSCLGNHTLDLIASYSSAEHLVSLTASDANNLVDCLMERHVRRIVASTKFTHCIECGELFNVALINSLLCGVNARQGSVDARGKIRAGHSVSGPPPSSDTVIECVTAVCKRDSGRVNWSSRFIVLSELQQAAQCKLCTAWFDGAHVMKCRFHPGMVKHSTSIPAENSTSYTCCPAKGFKFDLYGQDMWSGCETRAHVPIEQGDREWVKAALKRRGFETSETIRSTSRQTKHEQEAWTTTSIRQRQHTIHEPVSLMYRGNIQSPVEMQHTQSANWNIGRNEQKETVCEPVGELPASLQRLRTKQRHARELEWRDTGVV